MSTVNEPEHTEHPEGAASVEAADAASIDEPDAASTDRPDAASTDRPDAASIDGSGAATAPEPAGRDGSDTPADQQLATPEEAARDADDPATVTADPAETSIYVRRGRTPTLGFWVAIAIALPAVAALISAPFFNFADLGGVLNFVLLAAVIVGLPLATIVAVIDSVRHRRKSSTRR